VLLPLDHEKLFPAAGETLRSIAPLFPLQVAGESMAEAVGKEGASATEKEATEEQLLRSETVTPYVPEIRFCKSSEDAPLDHKKIYVPAGETVRSIEPLGELHDVLGPAEPVKVKVEFVLLISKAAVLVQPSSPVTVTVYVPPVNC
jgi:hypothetical protein